MRTSTVFVALVVAGWLVIPTAEAAVVTTSPFTGDLYEGFESHQGSTNPDSFSGFSGNGTFTNTAPDGGYLHTTTGWFGGQLSGAVVPIAGAYEGSILGSGLLDITFTQPLTSFGGYFNSLFVSGPSTISFYQGANLLTTLSITVGYGQWVWQGWSATAGDTFNRVVINQDLLAQYGGSGNSFLIMDDLRATVAPVPLPAAGWLLLSGLAGFGFIGRRRKAM